jgi:hypothetical protein
MKRALSGVLSRVNSIAEEMSRESEDDWDVLVERLKSARTNPRPRMSEEEEKVLLKRLWDWKLRGISYSGSD